MDTTDTDIGRRLRSVRDVNKNTQAEIAELLKVTKSTVSKYERGALSLTPSNINRLCNRFNINHNWLLTGNGDMFTPQSNTPDLNAKLARLPQKSAKALKILLDALDK